MEAYLFLTLGACAMIGFLYGIVRFFRRPSALYLRMIVFGVGCAMLGRFYAALVLLLHGQLDPGFNVGHLGIAGSFLFFFTANYGQMDSLVDDGSDAFRRYRLLSLLAPAAVAALCAASLARTGPSWEFALTAAISAVIAVASCFHLKHLIIPDVEFGIIRSIRSYNLLALIYALLCELELTTAGQELSAALRLLLCAAEGLCLLAIVPVLGKGVKQWTI